MKSIKQVFAVILIFSLLCMISLTAYAHEAPDMTQSGSVFVSMTYEGKAVPGGVLTFYQVGDVFEDDGNYSFVLTDDFVKSGVSLEDISSPELAEALAEYVSSNGLNGTAEKIDDKGTLTADGLTLGLYLVVQTQPAEGYNPVDPFLVSMPMNDDGVYIYDLDAAPKLSAITEALATPGKPSDSKLPQTGQLNWPIPALTAGGLLMFAIGWALCSGKREKVYEA